MGIRSVSPKRRVDFGIAASEGIVLTGFFKEKELELFFKLIQHRRQLPVFHGDFWRCYDCDFESGGLDEMAVHIMESHKPTSINVEDERDRELAVV